MGVSVGTGTGVSVGAGRGVLLGAGRGVLLGASVGGGGRGVVVAATGGGVAWPLQAASATTAVSKSAVTMNRDIFSILIVPISRVLPAIPQAASC